MKENNKSKELRTALVTGGSRGIGAEIAAALGKAGFFVVVNYRENGEAARKTLDRIDFAGGQGNMLQADVSQYDEVQRLFDETESRFGPVDVLVNNAGLEIRRPSIEYDEATYDRIMNTNLKGAFFCASRAIRTMKERRWGRVINVSSIHDDRPTGNRSVYSMSKAALVMMTREMAREYGGDRITVNAISPGAIRTDLNRKVLEDPAYEERVLRNIPARFIAEPSDVSGAVVFLVGEEARYINGAHLVIDGGMSQC